MKIIVFGGDGFCGWPTALHLSESGHEVVIVDNLSRRKIDNELGTNSLTPIKPIEVRINAWEEITGKKIRFLNIDISKDFDRLLDLLVLEKLRRARLRQNLALGASRSPSGRVAGGT